jgi:D-sedoheptulose 7-phosphate isomerase
MTGPSAAGRRILDAFADAAAAVAALPAVAEDVERAARLMADALRAGRTLLFCGNGGSAADAQHLAAEFMGRYMRERAPLPALSLTVDTSALTAIGNDYGFDRVFARQLSGIARPGDVLVAISTSGRSRNVVEAIAAARERGVAVVGLTGRSGGDMAGLCDVCIKVPSDATPRIQELHIVVGHVLCELVEDAFA